MARVGIVSLQGDSHRHADAVTRLGHDPVRVRVASDLAGCAAIIVPGGESTTIGKLMRRFGLLHELADRIRDGLPVFGTCAGTILLATTIVGSEQERLSVLPMTVERNAYGRQDESFEATLTVRAAALQRPDPLVGVFIRAPVIVDAGEATVLAEHEQRPVLVQSDAMLAATFHPELTTDDRVHRYFLTEVAGV